MQVIYSIGRPGYLDFFITDKRETVPAEAIILAICTATSTVENMDEDLFDALSDQEYFTIKRLVFEATMLEAEACQAKRLVNQSTLEFSVSRFFRWLTDTTSIDDIQSLQKNPSNC